MTTNEWFGLIGVIATVLSLVIGVIVMAVRVGKVAGRIPEGLGDRLSHVESAVAGWTGLQREIEKRMEARFNSLRELIDSRLNATMDRISELDRRLSRIENGTRKN